MGRLKLRKTWEKHPSKDFKFQRRETPPKEEIQLKSIARGIDLSQRQINRSNRQKVINGFFKIKFEPVN
jgi:hypothetical protein